MPDLINDFGITRCFTAGETLEGSEHKIGRIFKVKDGLYPLKIVSGLVRELAIFDRHTPLTAPFAIDLDTYYSIHASRTFLVNGILHQDKHIRHKHSGATFVEPGIFLSKPPFH